MKCGILDWVLEQRKEVSEKTGEIWVNSGVYLIKLKCLLNFDKCTKGSKTMVDKTTGALAGLRAMAPNCTCTHCTVHFHTKYQVRLRMSLMEQKKY